MAYFNKNNYPQTEPKGDDFQNEKENDMKILRQMLACGRYCAVTPFNLHGRSYCIQFTTIIFLLAFTCYTYISITIKLMRLGMLTVSGGMVDCLCSLLELIFVVVCLVNSNIFLLHRWNMFYKNLGRVEVLMRKFNFKVTSNMCAYYFEIFLLFFITLGLHGYEYVVWFLARKYKGLFIYLSFIIAHCYMNYVLLFTCYFSQVLKRRFNFLNGVMITMAGVQDPDSTVLLKLDTIINFYKEVFMLQENFNKIFGWHLFLYVALTVMYIIIDVILCLEFGLDASINTPDYLLTLGFIISIIVLVMYCDSAERSGRKIIRTCYLVHERVKSEVLRKKLMELVRYAEQWRPIFSAAGFYEVNRSTLNAVFESSINYLVILLQFTLALRELEDAEKNDQ